MREERTKVTITDYLAMGCGDGLRVGDNCDVQLNNAVFIDTPSVVTVDGKSTVKLKGVVHHP